MKGKERKKKKRERERNREREREREIERERERLRGSMTICSILLYCQVSDGQPSNQLTPSPQTNDVCQDKITPLVVPITDQKN